MNNKPFTYTNLKSKYNMNIKGIIHVGAHYGEEVGDYINSGINDIVLFEPLKDNFRILSERIKEFQANIILHQVALGSSENKTSMYVSDNEKQSSSILKPKVHLSHHPDVYFPDIEEVEVKLLDNYEYNEYNYLHMDVQGYELEVLKGATETLKHIDFIYCEVNRDELYEGNAYVEQIDEFLSEYDMKRVETYWLGDLWGDALYVKIERW
jgi:FkbM family methyltransferase